MKFEKPSMLVLKLDVEEIVTTSTTIAPCAEDYEGEEMPG